MAIPCNPTSFVSFHARNIRQNFLTALLYRLFWSVSLYCPSLGSVSSQLPPLLALGYSYLSVPDNLKAGNTSKRMPSENSMLTICPSPLIIESE